MLKKKTQKSSLLYNNKGTTLVEVLVCFLLLAIFMVAAFSIITHISRLYYQVKGETYGKQVTDILEEKIKSEIEGAKLESDVVVIGDGKEEGNVNDAKVSGTNVTLYDKTDTKVTLYLGNDTGSDSDPKYFMIKYYGYTNSEEEWEDDIWQFDKNVYNGYTVSELHFIKASALNEGSVKTLASSYGITNTEGYGDDVMVVLIKIHSDKYGDYTSYKFVRMYNYKEGNNQGS